MNSFLKKYSDILLAALVIGIVGMMIVPLPAFVLDLLLTLNFAIAVALLMVSLYIPNALRISSFPSILLITTLFRLSLNVSSTRLILLNAEAGDVIAAFGQFVVQGNFIVGAVIFIILTLIQFLVVVKGAERVSEVGARFTLDAMPGKQLSIDADLRAGAFGVEQAQVLRAQLQRESKLYGAMDGAMKFVKGDAVASVLITAINIVAGIVIGVLQKGMSGTDAVQTYTLLTIGDGLVSQIPALLIATTAGIIVTRVSAEDEESAHLGRDIFGQILAQPKALAITGGLLVALGLIPGLPMVPFWILGGLICFVAFGLFRSKRQDDAAASETASAALKQKQAMTPIMTPLSVHFGVDCVFDDAQKQHLHTHLFSLNATLFEALGVRLPSIDVFFDDLAVSPKMWCVCIDEVPEFCTSFKPEAFFIDASCETLSILDVEAQPFKHPLTQQEIGLVLSANISTVEDAGYRLWSPVDMIAFQVRATLQSQAAEFVHMQLVQDMLEQLSDSHPVVVREVVPGLLTLLDLSQVFKRLVVEHVSLRNLPKILQVLAKEATFTKDHATLAEYVRVGLCRHITHQYTGSDGTLTVYQIGREIEEMIASSFKPGTDGGYMALPPSIIREIVTAVEAQITQGTVSPVVLLTEQRARRHLRQLLVADYPNIVVLSSHEIEPSTRVQVLGRIDIGLVG